MRTHRWLISTLAATAVALAGAWAGGRAQQTPAPRPLVDATKLRMQPEEAAAGGRVMGDPSQPGVYVTRNRFAPGQYSRPHYHDRDRYITVIKGTWWTGEGDVFRPETMIAIKEGGFMFHPAGFHHYDGARDEEVIVQIMGIGPVTTVRTEVDERGRPVPAPSGRSE
jgi:quercetin dioxygenase-like cupin family protein